MRYKLTNWKCIIVYQYNNIKKYKIKKPFEKNNLIVEIIIKSDLDQSKNGKGGEEIPKSER